MTSDIQQYLWDTVIWNDCYGLKNLEGPVSLVLDIGAHVGVFSLWAKMRFPAAKIIAFEPHAENFSKLRAVSECVPCMEAHRAALGRGALYYWAGSNSLTRTYLSAECAEHCADPPRRTKLHLPAMMLDEMLGDRDPAHLLVKLDCEGGEQVLLGHEPSEAVLRSAKFVVAEWHFYQVDDEGRAELVGRTMRWLHGFTDTHHLAFSLRTYGLQLTMVRRK